MDSVLPFREPTSTIGAADMSQDENNQTMLNSPLRGNHGTPIKKKPLTVGHAPVLLTAMRQNAAHQNCACAEHYTFSPTLGSRRPRSGAFHGTPVCKVPLHDAACCDLHGCDAPHPVTALCDKETQTTEGSPDLLTRLKEELHTVREYLKEAPNAYAPSYNAIVLQLTLN
jgi:hypothetical protein